MLLAARIHLRGTKEFEWKDNYDIWCCTSSNETINNDGKARYLTIELESYEKNVVDYCNSDKKTWLCKEVESICSRSESFEQTLLVLPPVELLNFFGLELNVREFSWEKDGEKIIVCNNNKASYYEDQIKSSIFIKKEYLDKYLKKNTLKYFAFTERLIPEVRHFEDETSLHFELENGKITKELRNFGKTALPERSRNLKCENCPYPNIKDNYQFDDKCLRLIYER